MSLDPCCGPRQLLLISSFGNHVQRAINCIDGFQPARCGVIRAINVIAITVKDTDARHFRLFKIRFVRESFFGRIPRTFRQIEIEIRVVRRNPTELPLHPLPVLFDFAQGRARNDFERDIALGEVVSQSAKVVRPKGTVGATGLPAWGEHKVVDEELGFAVKEVDESFIAVHGLKNVGFVDFDPRKLLDFVREFVMGSCQFLFFLEELISCFVPFLGGHDFVGRQHHFELQSSDTTTERGCVTNNIGQLEWMGQVQLKVVMVEAPPVGVMKNVR